MTTAFLMGIGFQELILLFFFLVPIFLIPLIAIIDALKSDFKGSNDKIIWVIVIIFLPFLGSLLYLLIGRGQKVGK